MADPAQRWKNNRFFICVRQSGSKVAPLIKRVKNGPLLSSFGGLVIMWFDGHIPETLTSCWEVLKWNERPKDYWLLILVKLVCTYGWFQCRCLMPRCRSNAAAAPGSKSSVHNTLQSQDSWILCLFGIMSSQGKRSWCAVLINAEIHKLTGL